MTARMLFGLTLVFSFPTTAVARQADTQTPAPQPACELHFWPASSVNTYPRPAAAQGGPVWSLLLGGKKRAEGLQGIRSDIASSLDAQGSMLALGKGDLAARLGLSSATIVVHEQRIEPGSNLDRIQTRRTSSGSRCYSELVVTGILYKAGSWGGHFLDSSFELREFGAGSEPSRVFRGGGSIKLIRYPAAEGQDTEAASAELNSAFRQGFDKFAGKVRTDGAR